MAPLPTLPARSGQRGLPQPCFRHVLSLLESLPFRSPARSVEHILSWVARLLVPWTKQAPRPVRVLVRAAPAWSALSCPSPGGRAEPPSDPAEPRLSPPDPAPLPLAAATARVPGASDGALVSKGRAPAGWAGGGRSPSRTTDCDNIRAGVPSSCDRATGPRWRLTGGPRQPGAAGMKAGLCPHQSEQRHMSRGSLSSPRALKRGDPSEFDATICRGGYSRDRGTYGNRRPVYWFRLEVAYDSTSGCCLQSTGPQSPVFEQRNISEGRGPLSGALRTHA